MSAYIPAAILGLIAGLCRTAFFSALPTPFSAIDPVLILILWETAALRPRHAFVAALSVGLVTDALSSLPPGSHILAYAAATWVAFTLFTRVFTNHGWPGLVGITTASFAAVHGVLALARLAQGMLEGWPGASPFGEATFAWMTVALGIHVAATFGSFGIIALGRKTFSRFFLTR